MSETSGITTGVTSMLEQAALFQTIFEEGPLGMTVVDQHFRFVKANGRFCRMVGYTEQELQELKFSDITHPDDLDVDVRQAQALATGEKSHYTIEKRYLTKDNVSLWARVTRSLIKNQDGQPGHYLTMIEDVSEYRQIEDELRETQSKFRSVVESAQEAIILADSNANIVSWNNGAKRIFGYSSDETFGRPLTLIIPERYREAHSSGVVRLSAGGIPKWVGKMVELVGLRRDGREFPLELSLSSWTQGEQTFYSGVIRDISDRKLAETAQSQLAAIVNSSNDAIVGKSLTGEVVIWNLGAQRLYGYSADEIVGRNASILIPPYHLHEEEQLLQSVKDGNAQHLETVRLTKTGAMIDVSIMVSPIEDAEGNLIGVSTIAHDISRRKAADAFVRQQAELLEMAHDAIFVRDTNGQITFWNKGAEKTYGWTKDEAIGQVSHDLLRSRFPVPRAEIEAHIQKSGEWEGEIYHTRRDETEVIVASRWAAQRDENGKPLAILEINNDITERKRAEEESMRAHRAAEQASAAKSEFLSRMSHELRTPMNAILGFAQLLEMDQLDVEQTESVEQILRGGEHLLGLINEVLDITRIESGNLTLSLEAVAVDELLDEALALLRPLARKSQISLNTDLRDIRGNFVTADQQRLKQVLLNLVSNAIKYNREGGAVKVVGENLFPTKMRINVFDTGMGILSHQLALLFEPFERLQAGQTDVQGTGLGLALSKHLVEAMGGSIGVKSIPGVGSTFWVDLPLTNDVLVPQDETLQAEPSVLTESSVNNYTVLYVEDNLANLRLVEKLMARRPNVKLIVTSQGLEGLGLAQKCLPDLILLDMHLPDLWGDEVLRRLKANSRTQEIPIVILSADVTPGRVQRLLDDGAEDYLAKPLDVKKFFTVVDEILARGGPDQPEGGS